MKTSTRKLPKDNTLKKKHYQKPSLQKFGSVVQLTSGTNGSATDISDPFTTQP